MSTTSILSASVLALLASLAGASAAAGCAKVSCEDTATCAGSAVTINPDSGEVTYTEVPPPAGCDPDVDPIQSASCIDDSYALFVDGFAGSDESPGTRAKPLKTITAALDKDRRRGRPRIYVCGEGPYAENLELPVNVSLVGGATCGSWALTQAPVRTKLNGAAVGVVVHIANATKLVTVSDFEIAPAPAVAAGASTVGVFVDTAPLAFRRVGIVAGPGRSAVPPTEKPTNHFTGSLLGNGGSSTQGGAAKTCQCPLFGVSVGGAGGGPNAAGSDGSSDPVGGTDGILDGKGGAVGCGGTGAAGGKPGLARAGGAGGRSAGRLTHDGWVPAAGATGEAGGPGGGGGGGAGGASGGPSGACGGCGGAGGVGGAGGGGSIAFAMLDANVTLEGCSFSSDQAGDGATGGSGQNGQSGGTQTAAGGNYCANGGGGNGAGGSGGGGGSCGISAAVLRSGGELRVDATTLLKAGAWGFAGGAGSGGTAGQGGPGQKIDGNPGSAGLQDQKKEDILIVTP